MSKDKIKKINFDFLKDKKKRISFILVIIAVTVIIGGWLWFVFLYDYIKVDDAYIYRDKATISSKILARIANVLVKEGDIVKKGQMLILLDNAELLAQKRQSEANLEYVKENANLAKINLERAEDDYKRFFTIYKSNNISYEEYSHYKKSYEAADESYIIALKQVEVSNAQLDLIMINVQNSIISAAFNGIVSKKWIVAGDVVQPGQPILSINNIEFLYIIANIEETKLSHIHLNNKVRISVDAYPGVKFKGSIIQIGADTASQFSLIPPNNASGNFTKITQRIPIKISIQLENPDDHISNYSLLPGMSVIVKIKKK